MAEATTAGAGLAARARSLVLTPRAAWAEISAEALPPGRIFTGYVLILAAINPVCFTIGRLVFGGRSLGAVYRVPVLAALTEGVVGYGLALASVWALALLIEGLAPPFGAVRDRAAAFRIAAYASTTGWLASVAYLVPALGVLALVGQLYTLWLIYLGVKILLQPRGRTLGYVALVVVCYMVLMMLVISLTKLLTALA